MTDNPTTLSDESEPHERFRGFLRAELVRRCARNPQYSLRACARYLGVDPATLSQLLAGKRRMTGRTIQKLGARFGLDAAAIERYARREELLEAGEKARGYTRKLEELMRDTATLIADREHYAILELTGQRDFRADSRWVARVLGITVDEVNVALHRLTRLGLLEMVAPDRWLDRSRGGATTAEGFAEGRGS